MENVPVTIIVKAPNQQFEDQMIQCELSWTIKKLKGYLSEVYPCKPSSEEQKLIYSGQLLNDAVILKDILRQYEGQDTHTVHLVFTPKNRILETDKSKESGITTDVNTPVYNSIHSTDGLRQRIGVNQNNFQGNPFNPLQNMSQQPFGGFPPNYMADVPYTTQPSSNEYLMAQQIAMHNMMQHIYMQYLNQYMNGVPPENLNMSQPPGSNLQSVPYYNQNLPETNNPPMAPPQQQNDAQVQPQQNNPPQQRFPNIVQEEVENRDWLDLFYAFSRLMILVTLVYFYSSPFRCLIVIVFMVLYYLYYIGCFRTNNPEANNNQENNLNAPNNVNNVQAPPQDQPAVPAGDVLPHEVQNIQNENGIQAQDANPSNEDAGQDNNRTPMIALVRTFVLSFFASLIPETPAL